MQKYLPLQNEIKVLKSDLSQAHLWLEEALGGDSTIDIQKEVMTPFAHKPFSLYIQNSENTLNELKDQEYMQALKVIEIKLKGFYSIAQQRWQDSKKHGIGSNMDQQFDRDFKNIIGLIDTLSLHVKQRIDNEIAERNYQFAWIIAFSLLINITMFTYLSIVRSRQQQYALSLFEEKEKAIITLRSIGDAVVITDKKGNVTFFNEMAEKLTEYKNSEVYGLHIDSVLNIHNVKTDEKIKTPISAVLNEGLSKLISNSSKLISKTGKEYIISDSAAPVKNQNGETFGTVLVFQNDTERHEIEQILKNSEARYRTLVENIQSHYFFYAHDVEGVFTYVSDSLNSILGYTAEEFLVHHSEYLTDNPQNKKVAEYTQKVISGLEVEPYLVEVHHKNGAVIALEVAEHAVFNDNNEVVSVEGIAKNVTDQKMIESHLESLGHIINESLNEIYIFDKETLQFNYVNRAARNNLGYTFDEMLAMYPYDINPDYSAEAFKKAISSLAQGKERKIIFETSHARKDGSYYPVEVHLQLIKNNDKEQYVAIILDRTEYKKAEAELKHQAQYDELTDLPNRTLFLDRLSLAIKKAKRNKRQIAVLFIDLDRFKEINDSVGHLLGDEVLKKTAERLKVCLRDTDTIARFGGDEFVVLVDDVKESAVVIDVVLKLMNKMLRPIKIDDHTFYLTLSLGIAIYPEDGGSAEILLKNSDAAMYKAKDDGRNTYQFYTAEMTEKAFEHVFMESNLRQALVKQEFIVYYQPQINAQSGRLIGMEALVRWQHPVMGLVSPAKFIPLAEEIGFIIPLDQWVMRTAMRQLVEWYKKGINPGVLTLNLAVKQLQEKDFIVMLSALLEETECKAEWLELEVTEGQIMKHPENAIAILKQIRDIGIRLAIDDFGTGYSSLSYLKRFPIDKLKIDQSFVRDLPDDEEDAAITRAVIALAKSLNLRIIAEGVETEEQKDFLVTNGCLNIQGYLYSKPMPVDEMEVYLEKY